MGLFDRIGPHRKPRRSGRYRNAMSGKATAAEHKADVRRIPERVNKARVRA